MSAYRKGKLTQVPESFDNCPDFLERYLFYLSRFEGKNPNTVIETAGCLREFCQYVHYCNKIREKPSTGDAHKDMGISEMDLAEIAAVTPEWLREYLAFLDVEVRNTSSTIAKKFCYIRALYAYLEANATELGIRFSCGNPAQTIHVPHGSKKTSVDVLTLQQIQKLVNSTDGETALRDSALILLIATTGIMPSEISALNMGDWDRPAHTLHIHGEEDDRYIHLTPACEKSIQRYLQSSLANEAQAYAPLFINSQTASRLTPRSIQMRIARAAANAGMADMNITARTLRDSAAVMLLQSCNKQERMQVLSALGYKDARVLKRFESVSSAQKSTAPPSMHAIIAASPLSTLGKFREG